MKRLIPAILSPKLLLERAGISFLSLCFPHLCIACQRPLGNSTTKLCGKCSQELVLLDPSVRCKRCFSTLDEAHDGEGCDHCALLPWPLLKLGCVFPYRGAPARLLKRLKYGGRKDLSETLGAYLVVQWSRLEWPIPDYIVPMPISRMRHWVRGYNQCYLLAEVLSEYLKVPICQVVGRHSGDWSQAGLNTNQRQQLSTASFYLTKEAEVVTGKTVLLIDDVLTTGKTLEQCAAVLLEAGPQSINGLTVCRRC